MFHCSNFKAIFLVLASLMFYTLPAYAEPLRVAGSACETWPDWNSFRGKFVSHDGRVLDHSIPQKVTTSEGQSYALMFALIANDRPSFDLILRWTENNLANGDLTASLPAWQWGQRPDGSWGVIDNNAASDADLWMAYVLNEAGQHWNIPRYIALAELLAARILREETSNIPGLGLVLLPGPSGFHPDETTWRLNPSYMPIQIMRRFAVLHPGSEWDQLIQSAIALILQSSPQGFVPDWADYQADKGFILDDDPALNGIGFNAIRVYLWAGMLNKRDPVYPVLLKQLAPLGKYVTETGVARKNASAGFSAALLPILKSAGLNETLHQQRQRIVALAPMEGSDNYYDQVLTLFGKGWLEGLYSFGKNGQLIPGWKCENH